MDPQTATRAVTPLAEFMMTHNSIDRMHNTQIRDTSPYRRAGYRRLMQLEASSRPLDDYDAEVNRWTVEADDYDDAFEDIRDTIPRGHVLLHVRRLDS